MISLSGPKVRVGQISIGEVLTSSENVRADISSALTTALSPNLRRPEREKKGPLAGPGPMHRDTRYDCLDTDGIWPFC